LHVDYFNSIESRSDSLFRLLDSHYDEYRNAHDASSSQNATVSGISLNHKQLHMLISCVVTNDL